MIGLACVLVACWALGASEEPLQRILAGGGQRADVPVALAALLGEPLVERRLALAGFLGRADLGLEALEPRVAALEALVLSDPDDGVRRRALEALADAWQRPAWERLDGLLERVEPALRPTLARVLAGRARIASRVRERVLAGAREGGDPRVLAPLLAAYGRSLAELPLGGEQEGELAPLVALARSADPELAFAANEAADGLFGRLRALGEPERAARLLARLEAAGADPAWCLRTRIETALRAGREADEALPAARALVRIADADLRPASAAGRVEARILEAVALLALERAGEAQARARGARDEAERALERLGEASGRAALEQAASLAGLAARARLTELLAQLMTEPAADAGSATLAAARELHRAALRAQLAALRAESGAAASLDALLLEADSPLVLLADNPWRRGFDRARALELEARLGRALASVAPRELPGFEPRAPAEDPLADPDRASLYAELLRRELSGLQELFGRELQRRMREVRGDPLGLDPAAESDLYELEARRRALLSESAAVEAGARERLLERRAPCTLALDLARAWRDEGRPAEARALVVALAAALERDPAAQRYLWGVELLAECEALRGNTWSDSGEPRQAEVELARAEERLEALERELESRGLARGGQLRLRAARAGVLVGLAVNANVKLRDPARALAYFERAWELRQDDFMKALRACYLARAARADEARALLREIVPAPGTLYNLACTWALLGEKAQALSYLERDFEQNLTSAGTRARQQAWAREDPDLAALRDEPRFQALLVP